jgi:hypothetical protein
MTAYPSCGLACWTEKGRERQKKQREEYEKEQRRKTRCTPSDCTDFFLLADGTRVCSIRPHDSPHVFCENLVKTGMCPKDRKEE